MTNPITLMMREKLLTDGQNMEAAGVIIKKVRTIQDGSNQEVIIITLKIQKWKEILLLQ